MHPRHMKLLDLICQNGRLAVTELSAKLGVSEVTIRKDLNMLAEELCARDCHITIITNSAFIASFVHKMRSARIILLGGSYQNEAQVMVGPLVGLCARNFKVDKFFLGIDGMDERGVKSSDHLRIEAAQAMAAQARGIIVLTESVKFHRDASELIFPYENIRAIYTDADVADSDIERCQTLGPEIVTAAKRRS